MPKDDKQKQPKAKAKVYKLPKKVRKKTFTKKEMDSETVNSLKEKARDHNAKVKGYLHIKLSQKNEALYRDVKFKRDINAARVRDSMALAKKQLGRTGVRRMFTCATPYLTMQCHPQRR